MVVTHCHHEGHHRIALRMVEIVYYMLEHVKLIVSAKLGRR